MNDMAIDSSAFPIQPGVTAKGLWPRFYLKPKAISKPVRDAEGRHRRDPDTDEPMWQQVEIVEEWVEITIVGDKQSVVCKKATPDVIERFPDHYRSWKDGAKGIVGTPIEQLTGITEQQVHEFKAANIYTIEGLAELSDLQLGKAGLGGRHLVLRAQSFLADRRGPGLEAQVQALTAERDETRVQLAGLQEQMAALIALVQDRGPASEIIGRGGRGGHAATARESRSDAVREGAEP